MKTAGPNNSPRRVQKTALAGAIGAALLAGGVHAQQQAAPKTPDNALVNLIRQLIDSGALKPEEGQRLLQEAQHESGSTDALAAKPPAAQAATPPAPAAPVAQPGDVRVPYVPQSVRDEIREQLKSEVLSQARQEHWAAPDSFPEWLGRLQPIADVRVRNESRFFDNNNSNIVVDWNTINSGSGYDVNPNTNLLLPPLLNTREDRTDLWQIRGRFGFFSDLGKYFSASIVAGTGNTDGPVSLTQALGGGLTKKNLWLDETWIAWRPFKQLQFIAGRFDNPYWSDETIFSNDLRFDGVAGKLDLQLAKKLSVFVTGGLHPLKYSTDNFPANSEDKLGNRNEWLVGGQTGGELAFTERNRLRAAVAFYDFRRVSGLVSDSCALYSGANFCSTDWAVPPFMQKGNTLMLLRNIALNPQDPANTPEPQYVGLASEFRVLSTNGRWTLPAFAGYSVVLDVSGSRNLAYARGKLWNRSGGALVNNLGTPVSGQAPSAADIQSGPFAYQLQLTFGVPELHRFGDWNLAGGYRRVDPDAVPDAYNDADFHLGGTNAKGYYTVANVQVDKRVWLTGSWFAARQVYGEQLTINLLQVDINASL